MHATVFIDQFIDALRNDRELVVLLNGGAKLVLYPEQGMNFTIPENTGIVSPYEPEGTNCSFETRSQAYGDRDLIGLKGRFTLYSAGAQPQTMDHTWLNIDPAHISAIFVGDKITAGTPV